MGKHGSMLKRISDIFFSLLILVISLPFLLLAIIAIKIESSGPAFFRHERMGYKSKIFKLYKLRGMVNNALEVGPELTQLNDPRITKVGRFLRRTSIDEIPNFINVLKGEMCLVGPRPEIPSITRSYSDEQRKIFDFKPGVTGISQINGRQMLKPNERVKMEIEYYSKANFWSDFKIALITIPVIFTNEGNI